MKIKRIKIIGYGPIEKLTLEPEKGFQVIFGKNEAGKTLTVDAIILLLSGVNIKEINRVGEIPEGEVVIDKDGKIITISRKTKKPTDYLNIDDPFDLKNIFIIRDSDLRIDNESDLMRRLVGIESQRMNKIRNSLLQIGRLSEKRLELSDRYDHIKQRYDNTERLIKEIKDYLAEVEKEKMELLEIEYAKLGDEVGLIESRIQKLEDARKAEDYERLKKALSDFRGFQRKSQELNIFNSGQLDLLTRYRNAISSKEEEQERINSDIKRKEERQKELLERREQLVSDLPEKGAEEEIMKIRKGFEKLPLSLPESFLNKLPYIFIPLFAVFAVFYYLFKLHAVTMVFGAAAIIVTLLFLYGLIRSARIEMRKRRLKREAEKYGIFIDESNLKNEMTEKDEERKEGAGEQEGEVEAGAEKTKVRDSTKDSSLILMLHGYTEEIKRKLNSLNRIEAELKIISEELDEERPITQRLKKETVAAKSRLETEFRKLGIDNLDDFYLKMESREKSEKKLVESKQSLVDYFRTDDYDAWERGVDDLRHGSSEIIETYSQAELENLRQKKKKKEEKIENIRGLLNEHRSRLKEFERRVGNLGLSAAFEPDLSVETVDGLKRILSILNDFISETDENTNVARIAIDVLDKLSREDENRLTDILSERFNASEILSQITSRRYKKINYDPEKKMFSIVQSNGIEKDLSKLSKGTFDQLYLSVRIAIAEGIGEGPRFMIMDDPFLTSDHDRLITQFEVLKKLVERGWQVIYFTVKEEVRKLARDYTSADIIELKSNF